LFVWLPLAAFVTAADSADCPSPFRFVERTDEGTLTLFEAQRPVFVYNFADRLKPGLAEDRRRSCYVHPIYGLDGETLTEDFPPEGHFHHRGLCWAWAEVKVGERVTDPWDLRGIRARFRSWIERRADSESATLAAEDEWVLDGEQVVATEVLRWRVYPATDVGRAIDVDWTIAAKAASLAVAGRPKAGYGGLMLRFPHLPQTVITTSEGPCAWADLSSCFTQDERRSGAAIFLHPAHPGIPVGWTLRHYGFLNPAWPGTTPVILKPDEPITLRYRLWIHRGDAAAGGVQQAYEAYRRTASLR
jgi:hypothetical protein